jgi:hypothetical protein
MKSRIDTPDGKRIYARRLAIVEPVFANLRVQKRLDHFTVRFKAKVDMRGSYSLWSTTLVKFTGMGEFFEGRLQLAQLSQRLGHAYATTSSSSTKSFSSVSLGAG